MMAAKPRLIRTGRIALDPLDPFQPIGPRIYSSGELDQRRGQGIRARR
jgi:hypothetical protein